MSNQSKDGTSSAFPVVGLDFGLTQREYAAIHLRVPDSGTPWLDAMIEKARRDDFAKAALPMLELGRYPVGAEAYSIADEMQAAAGK